jgi:SulP family sulfate permease
MAGGRGHTLSGVRTYHLCFLCYRGRLAGIVSYIPLPVIAGYLAYVGYFCFAAGVAQATALAIGAPDTWGLLWQHPESLPKFGATALVAVVIFWAVHRWKSPAALPTVLTVFPVLWYMGMWAVVVYKGLLWDNAVHWLADHEWTAAVPQSSGEPIWEVCLLFNVLNYGEVVLGGVLRGLASFQTSNVDSGPGLIP